MGRTKRYCDEADFEFAEKDEINSQIERFRLNIITQILRAEHNICLT